MKNSHKLKISCIILVMAAYAVLSLCLKAQSNALSAKQKQMLQQNKGSSQKLGDTLNKNGINNHSDKVIINVVNIGRDNPFKPYGLKSTDMLNSDNIKLPAGITYGDIPPPPTFDPVSSGELKNMLECKISGILYDPEGKSVAIVNVKGTDYMVRKGDSVYDYYVERIGKNFITLRYMNNRYTLSPGESTGGTETAVEPVRRGTPEFAGNNFIFNKNF